VYFLKKKQLNNPFLGLSAKARPGAEENQFNLRVNEISFSHERDEHQHSLKSWLKLIRKWPIKKLSAKYFLYT